jgi:hypothetical protein
MLGHLALFLANLVQFFAPFRDIGAMVLWSCYIIVSIMRFTLEWPRSAVTVNVVVPPYISSQQDP